MTPKDRPTFNFRNASELDGFFLNDWSLGGFQYGLQYYSSGETFYTYYTEVFRLISADDDNEKAPTFGDCGSTESSVTDFYNYWKGSYESVRAFPRCHGKKQLRPKQQEWSAKVRQLASFVYTIDQRVVHSQEEQPGHAADPAEEAEQENTSSRKKSNRRNKRRRAQKEARALS